MSVSIRGLMILMTLSFVFLTAVVSVTLALVSADNALQTTKDSSADTVDQCFSFSAFAKLTATTQFLSEKADRVTDFLRQYLRTAEGAGQTMNRLLSSVPPNRVHDFTWYESLFPSLWSQWESIYKDVSVMGFVNVAGQAYIIFKSPAKDIKSWHLLTLSNGTVSSIGTIKPFSGEYYREVPCNPASAFLQLDESISGPCRIPVDLSSLDYGKDLLARLPLGVFQWGKVISQFSYTGIMYESVFGPTNTAGNPIPTPGLPGNKAGIAIVGTELRDVSRFLGEVDFGTNLSRMYLVAGAGGNQTGRLVAVSHNDSAIRGRVRDPILGHEMEGMSPIQATEAPDSLISQTARWVEGANSKGLEDAYEAAYLRQSNSGGFETIPLNVNGTARDFFLVVKRALHTESLNWWNVITIDREAVVGEVERKKSETAREISASNKRVDDELSNDRIVLYVVVVVVAILFVLLTVLATRSIIRPLDTLRQEMEIVSTMQLEGVERRPLSNLDEVHSMQSSFYTMIACLMEFRQYMPQSILNEQQQDIKDDASVDALEECDGMTTSEGTSVTGSGIFVIQQDRRKGSHSTHDSRDERQARAPAQLALGLTRKRNVAQVRLTVKNFSSGLKDPVAFVSVHTLWLTILSGEAKESRGTIERFLADEVDVNFGGLLFCNAVSQKAANYVVRVLEHIDSRALNIRPVIGVGSGSALVGNLGCTGLKNNAVVGHAVEMSRVMHCLARELGLGNCMGALAAEDSKGHFDIVPVDIVYFHKRQIVYHLKGRRAVSTDEEWMYHYNKADGPYEKAWNTLCAGKVEEASMLFLQLSDDPVAVAVGRRIHAFVEEVAAAHPSIAIVDYFRKVKSSGCCTVAGDITSQENSNTHFSRTPNNISLLTPPQNELALST